MTAPAPSRRRRDQGTVARTPDALGRYQARYRDVDGRRRAVYGRTPEEAAAKLAAAIVKRDEGIPAPDRRTTLGGYLDRWIDGMAPGRLRPRSELRYRYVVGVWRRDPIGRSKLAELTPLDVSAAMRRMDRAGASPRTIGTNLAILRIALADAVRAGIAGRNVAKLVDAPKVEPTRIRPPAGDDLARLRAAIATDRLEALWSLALGAGLRHGEILGLHWRDVDLGAGIVTVTGTLQEGSEHVGPTKSRHGARRIPVAPWVLDALRRHHDRVPGVIPAPGAWVFATSSGQPYDATNVRRFWHRVCDRAGVRRYRIHDLRHAAATELLGHWPMATVSRYIGHATIQQTVDTYGHPTFDGLSFPDSDARSDARSGL